ncbi:MAG: hypothetical protein OT477_14630 [Chloroflexi bacterium]|nr:hypothetical protein [Chloroflexota bacterium]
MLIKRYYRIVKHIANEPTGIISLWYMVVNFRWPCQTAADAPATTKVYEQI